LLLLAGCGGPDSAVQQPLLLDATVVFPPRDTVRFAVPATTRRCSEPKTLLLEAITPEGSGVLLRLHYRDSLRSAAYRVVPPGDTTTPAAVVAVRYMLRESTHGFSFDSGSVQVTRTGDKISGQMEGSGIENAIRTRTRITYRDVPMPAATDTNVSCAFQP
jgi:hypothetical protein